LFERSENAKFYIIYVVHAERSSQLSSRFEDKVCPHEVNEFQIVNNLLMKGCHIRSFIFVLESCNQCNHDVSTKIKQIKNANPKI